ncbi:hypothetical protein [Prochlorococcus marinus]|nr:hypothetical protein [Prochlorococcus marinus]
MPTRNNDLDQAMDEIKEELLKEMFESINVTDKLKFSDMAFIGSEPA